MKTRRSYALAGSVGVTLAFLLMLAAGLLLTGPEGANAGEAESGQAAGPAEGIKVHGHWTIEVRDPDGTLVERREFDNAITGEGEMILTRILGRVETVGNWQIYTLSPPASEVCEAPVATPHGNCHIAEAGDPTGGANNFFETLSLSLSSAPDPYSLNLSGYLIAQRDGSIYSVYTVVYTCESAISPDLCVGAGGSAFGVTDTTLPSPVPALTGQQVLVTVVISFS